jgi:hypothetical protein
MMFHKLSFAVSSGSGVISGTTVCCIYNGDKCNLGLLFIVA